MKSLHLPPAAALLLALLAGEARADTFHLRDGTRLEGEILRTFRDDSGGVDRWEVRTLAGRRTLSAAEVREVRGRPADAPPYPWVHFENRFAFEDPADPAKNLELGLWARAEGMEAEARRAFRRAVAADPAGRTESGARARALLGHVKVDGRWTVPAGVESGPEERGEPVTGGDPSPLEALLGRMVARRRSENFHLESDWLDQASLGRYLDTLERVREAALEFLGDPPPVGGGRSVYRLLGKRADYLRAVDDGVSLELLARGEGGLRLLSLYRAGHLARVPGEAVCLALRVSEDDVEDRAFLAHHAVHEVWRTPAVNGARWPDWLQEAFAYGVLNDRFPDDPCWCVAAGYGREDRVPPTWRNTRAWPAAARALAASGKAMAFQDLAVLDLNSLTFDGLVQSWSVLAFLRAKDANGTRAFLRRVRRGEDQFAALKECLRMAPADVDRLWRAEVLKRR